MENKETLIANTVTSISGMPKSGKTYLSFTWPEPILSYSFESGATYIAKKFFPKKDITVREFTLPIIESDSPAPYAEKIWEEFQKEYKEAVYGGKYQTIIIDPATSLWAILRQAITEAKNRKKLLEVEYALPNLKMSAIYSHARVSGVNLVVIQYLKDRYINGENTGELTIDGWNQTAGQADIVLQMSRILKGGKCQMQTEIVDNRFVRDFNGKSFIDTTYDDISALLLGD